MTTDFNTAQRIVLHGTPWEAARHLVLNFPDRSSAAHFLGRLEHHGFWPTAAQFSAEPQPSPRSQVSLGFSRRGLEHARVPSHVLSLLALKSPAFHAGAAMRAATHLGATAGHPQDWEPPYGFTTLDAVISVHGRDQNEVDHAIRYLHRITCEAKVRTHDLLPARRLPTPKDETDVKDAMWTHFGFRDGLSRVGIEGWTRKADMDECKEGSRHNAGEFLLGHPQNSGANPWITWPDGRVWPEAFRSFFHNGSFGVLHQIRQDVAGFEAFVRRSAAVALRTVPEFFPPARAEETRKDCVKRARAEIKAKLCGRYTNGRPIAAEAKPEDDFDYTADPEGNLCPFGAHARRMNPRGENLAHSVRRRPLLRRGLPYGVDAGQERGLMGQFFCASIEDQFEHLVGQWADRVPLGSPDVGGARDPMFGAHAPDDGAFVIPRHEARPLALNAMPAFATTVGLAYLFYPSLTTLAGIRDGSMWRP